MTHRLNLARRPFVDSRPVNLAAGVLSVVIVVMTIVSVSTVRSYLAGSKKTREMIGSLRAESARLDAERTTVEAALSRVDIAGLSVGAEDANSLARRRVFSWTRFLTRLEEVLPEDVRVTQISLARRAGAVPAPAAATAGGAGTAAPAARPDEVEVQLALVSRDPDGMPKVVRAFYASRWFDRPQPASETGPEKGVAEGTTLNLSVSYVDAGRVP